MSTVKFLDLGPDTIAAETVIRASAADIYAFIADPSRHAELDGGGSVRQLAAGATTELTVGDTFTQKMFLGIPYRMSPVVVRAQKNRAITWQLPAARHTWAWDIFDNGNGTVTVRETWDATDARIGSRKASPLFRVAGVFRRNRKNIALSLAKLHRTFEG